MNDSQQYNQNFKHKKYIQLAKDLAPLYTPYELDDASAESVASELEHYVNIKGGYHNYGKNK